MPAVATRRKHRGKLRDLRSGKVLPSLEMSETDFLAWIDRHVYAEWVDGKVELMSPVNIGHAEISQWLAAILHVYCRRKQLGVVISAEVMVRLDAVPSRRIPDLMFIDAARRKIMKPTHFEGAPDLIVEIVSPDSVSRDWGRKFREYEDAGVREYWIVDPLSKIFESHSLQSSGKYARITERDGRIFSQVIKDFYLRPSWFWMVPLPDELKVLKELGVRS